MLSASLGRFCIFGKFRKKQRNFGHSHIYIWPVESSFQGIVRLFNPKVRLDISLVVVCTCDVVVHFPGGRSDLVRTPSFILNCLV